MGYCHARLLQKAIKDRWMFLVVSRMLTISTFASACQVHDEYARRAR